MKNFTNLINVLDEQYSLESLISVKFSHDDFLHQIALINDVVDLGPVDVEHARLDKIFEVIKKSREFEVTLTLDDWIFLSEFHCLGLTYHQLAEYPAFVMVGICPKITLEIDDVEFCEWLEKSTKDQLWDIENDFIDKHMSADSSYLNEMMSKVEEYVDQLNKYRAWDALDFSRIGGFVRIYVDDKIVMKLDYDDRSEPRERYIFETLTNWLCDLSGFAYQNAGLIFFDKKV